MPNPHGSFIWYELLTTDADAAAAFYRSVVGWTAASAGQSGVDYRIFSAGDGPVAGHMTLPPNAAEAGMKPGWLGYIGVDDVDRAVEDVVAAGGAIHMPAMTLEGVGRMAMVADPQGAAFYVMRGASEEESRSFAQANGHCAWNELVTSDQAAALAFYAGRFGWEKGDAMPMGEMGDYQLIEHGGAMIGAVMTRRPDDPPARWGFYFQVADIDAAVREVTGNGGSVMYGPVEIPGGDFAIHAVDPQGAAFGLVGPRP